MVHPVLWLGLLLAVCLFLIFSGGSAAAAGSAFLGAKGNHTCMRLATGAFHCWGEDVEAVTSLPANRRMPADAEHIVVLRRFGCALQQPGGKPFCWGRVPSDFESQGIAKETFTQLVGTSFYAARDLFSSNPDYQPNDNFSGNSEGLASAGLAQIQTYLDDTNWPLRRDLGSKPPDTGIARNTLHPMVYGTNENHGLRASEGPLMDKPTGSENGFRTDIYPGSLELLEMVCGLRADGKAVCWGAPKLTATGAVPPPQFEYEEIALGFGLGCGYVVDDIKYALRKNVVCQGAYSLDAQSTDTYASEQSRTVPYIAGTRDIKKIVLGAGHRCHLIRNPSSTIKCHGNASYPILSIGGPFTSTVSGIAPAAKTPTGSGKFTDQMAAGKFFTCIIDNKEELDCWGADTFGVVSQKPSGKYTGLAAGDYHACALSKESGLPNCWGSNAYGQTDVPLELLGSQTAPSPPRNLRLAGSYVEGGGTGYVSIVWHPPLFAGNDAFAFFQGGGYYVVAVTRPDGTKSQHPVQEGMNIRRIHTEESSNPQRSDRYRFHVRACLLGGGVLFDGATDSPLMTGPAANCSSQVGPLISPVWNYTDIPNTVRNLQGEALSDSGARLSWEYDDGAQDFRFRVRMLKGSDYSSGMQTNMFDNKGQAYLNGELFTIASTQRGSFDDLADGADRLDTISGFVSPSHGPNKAGRLTGLVTPRLAADEVAPRDDIKGFVTARSDADAAVGSSHITGFSSPRVAPPAFSLSQTSLGEFAAHYEATRPSFVISGFVTHRQGIDARTGATDRFGTDTVHSFISQTKKVDEWKEHPDGIPGGTCFAKGTRAQEWMYTSRGTRVMVKEKLVATITYDFAGGTDTQGGNKYYVKGSRYLGNGLCRVQGEEISHLFANDPRIPVDAGFLAHTEKPLKLGTAPAGSCWFKSATKGDGFFYTPRGLRVLVKYENRGELRGYVLGSYLAKDDGICNVGSENFGYLLSVVPAEIQTLDGVRVIQYRTEVQWYKGTTDPGDAPHYAAPVYARKGVCFIRDDGNPDLIGNVRNPNPTGTGNQDPLDSENGYQYFTSTGVVVNVIPIKRDSVIFLQDKKGQAFGIKSVAVIGYIPESEFIRSRVCEVNGVEFTRIYKQDPRDARLDDPETGKFDAQNGHPAGACFVKTNNAELDLKELTQGAAKTKMWFTSNRVPVAVTFIGTDEAGNYPEGYYQEPGAAVVADRNEGTALFTDRSTGADVKTEYFAWLVGGRLISDGRCRVDGRDISVLYEKPPNMDLWKNDEEEEKLFRLTKSGPATDGQPAGTCFIPAENILEGSHLTDWKVPVGLSDQGLPDDFSLWDHELHMYSPQGILIRVKFVDAYHRTKHNTGHLIKDHKEGKRLDEDRIGIAGYVQGGYYSRNGSCRANGEDFFQLYFDIPRAPRKPGELDPQALPSDYEENTTPKDQKQPRGTCWFRAAANLTRPPSAAGETLPFYTPNGKRAEVTFAVLLDQDGSPLQVVTVKDLTLASGNQDVAVIGYIAGSSFLVDSTCDLNGERFSILYEDRIPDAVDPYAIDGKPAGTCYFLSTPDLVGKSGQEHRFTARGSVVLIHYGSLTIESYQEATNSAPKVETAGYVEGAVYIKEGVCLIHGGEFNLLYERKDYQLFIEATNPRDAHYELAELTTGGKRGGCRTLEPTKRLEILYTPGGQTMHVPAGIVIPKTVTKADYIEFKDMTEAGGDYLEGPGPEKKEWRLKDSSGEFINAGDSLEVSKGDLRVTAPTTPGVPEPRTTVLLPEPARDPVAIPGCQWRKLEDVWDNWAPDNAVDVGMVEQTAHEIFQLDANTNYIFMVSAVNLKGRESALVTVTVHTSADKSAIGAPPEGCFYQAYPRCSLVGIPEFTVVKVGDGLEKGQIGFHIDWTNMRYATNYTLVWDDLVQDRAIRLGRVTSKNIKLLYAADNLPGEVRFRMRGIRLNVDGPHAGEFWYGEYTEWTVVYLYSPAILAQIGEVDDTSHLNLRFENLGLTEESYWHPGKDGLYGNADDVRTPQQDGFYVTKVMQEICAGNKPDGDYCRGTVNPDTGKAYTREDVRTGVLGDLLGGFNAAGFAVPGSDFSSRRYMAPLILAISFLVIIAMSRAVGGGRSTLLRALTLTCGLLIFAVLGYAVFSIDMVTAGMLVVTVITLGGILIVRRFALRGG